MFEMFFFPLGNADTTRITSPQGRRFLFDFAPLAASDGEFGLEEDIRNDLRRAGKDGVDVLCITHLDDDHCRYFEEVFHLEHSASHQGNGRLRIENLWVPAMAIIETGLKEESARQVQKEARHRLRKGTGIVVFSAPEALDDWLRSEGIDPASRRACIRYAGELVLDWSLHRDGIEFFVHSPLSWRQDEQGKEIARNSASVVLQVVMRAGGTDTRLFLGADVDSEDLAEVVKSTRQHDNDERLGWDVLKLFHHCSYKSLNKDDRGATETKARLGGG